MCLFFFKTQLKVKKNILHECDKKNLFAVKSVVCSKIATLNILYLFLAKCFIIFLLRSWTMLLHPSVDFYRTKRTCCQNKLCLILKHLDAGWKNLLFNVSPKTVFWNRIWCKNPHKKLNWHPKKCVKWFFFI